MKKLIFLLLPTLALSQVGINTDNPQYTLDIVGNLGVHNVQSVTSATYILVQNENDPEVKRIPLSSIQTGSKCPCPTFDKNVSNAWYLKFTSTCGSVEKPNNPVNINGLNFGPAGAYINGNMYHYSWTNTTGTPLDINNFTVDFGTQKCVYQ